MPPARRSRRREEETTRLADQTVVGRTVQEEGVEEPPPASRRARPGAAEPRESVWTRGLSPFGPSVRDMAMFCRQLSTLLDVGVPLLRSLKILGVRTQHPRLKRVVTRVADEVESGNRFSTALSRFPHIFSPLFVNVVRVGESAGILEASMRRLAEIMESKASIRRRIVAASAYPIAALSIAALVIGLVMTFAIPRFEEIYSGEILSPGEAGASTVQAPTIQDGVVPIAAQPGELTIGNLPWPTRVAIDISHFLRDYWIVAVLGVLILLALLYLFFRSRTGRRWRDWMFLRAPAFSIVNRKVAIARTTRTLGSLIAAGIPLLEALRITAQGSENAIVSAALNRVHDTVEQGGKLEDQLRKEYHVFPPVVVDMIAIGDEAGALDVMLLKLADNYDEEVDTTLRGLTAIIEPVLIVVMGLLVIFIALALLWPYFRLIGAMR
jgi:type IV pilus assembly protein PilC